MKRVRELISMVQEQYPADRFFVNFEQTRRLSWAMRAQYEAYERAFICLDEQSWVDLRTKALRHFNDHRVGQRKQGFFNQLNDAFAYQYLLSRGFDDLRVLAEDGKKRPDLSYSHNEELCFCEVKTISVSDDEIARRSSGKSFSSANYCELTSEFFSKLSSTLDMAFDQINSQGGGGLIYLILNFDDLALDHYDTYRRQIMECL
ncbi:MAG: hypothetical protein WAM90_04985, partial [Rhodanobacter sp.]